HAREEENRAETVSNFRLLRTQRMAGTKSCRAIARKCRPGVFGATSRYRITQKRNQSPEENGESRSVVVCDSDMCLAPKAPSHVSLGHRPRNSVWRSKR